MSTKVIKSISTTYGSLTGNVSSISTSEAYVADMNDINSLESKLNNEVTSLRTKNESLEKEMELLKDLVKKVVEENHNMKRTLLSEFDAHVEKGRDILWNTYEQIAKNTSKQESTLKSGIFKKFNINSFFDKL